MMARHMNDIIATLPQAEQETIHAEHQRLRKKYIALQEIRKLAGLSQLSQSQEQLAKALDRNY